MSVYIIMTIITCMSLYGVQEINRRYVFKYAFVLGSESRERQKKKSGFLLIFLILAIFSAVRDGVGCDYDSYIMHIQRIQSGTPHYMEIGFQWVCKQVAEIDANPRIVIIIFAVATCFFYLRSIWDQSDDVLFSVFIFMTWGYYFMTFNTIRNYFALSIALYSIKYLNNKKYIQFILMIIAATLFHKSALVCIPLYILAKKDYKVKHIPVLLCVIAAAFLLKGPIRNVVFQLYPSYLGSAYDTGRVSYLNIFKALVVVALCAMYWVKIKDDKLIRMYFNLNLFSLVFYTAFYWIPEISRIGFYMNATTILLLPRLAQKVGRTNRIELKSLICVFSIVLFLLLLVTFGSETTRLLPYKSWLFGGSF